MRGRFRVEDVVGELCGAVDSVKRLRTTPWAPPDLQIYTATVREIDIGAEADKRHLRSVHGSSRVYGNGNEHEEQAQRIAAVEALERYASAVYSDDQLTTASGNDLGPSALDLTTVARCSARELSRPDCPIHPPDPDRPIRWVEGIDLLSGQVVLVPAVMTYLDYPATPDEQFWLQISTGCAAHPDLPSAVSSAICEVIERDAAAVLWLQRLKLPLVHPACLPAEARAMIEWCDANFVQTYLYDATTDLGVPTVYCLQVAPHARCAVHLVSSATDLDPQRAVSRALSEVVGLRAGVYALKPPRRYADFSSPAHGAATMGKPQHARAFSFLLKETEGREQSHMPEKRDLPFLLRTLEAHGCHVYCVDQTTRELDEAGLVAVRVIIPELQPMSLMPRAQYKRHPRVYQAPVAMGYFARSESTLSRWPQPIA